MDKEVVFFSRSESSLANITAGIVILVLFQPLLLL
jgi:hypothetical protein